MSARAGAALVTGTAAVAALVAATPDPALLSGLLAHPALTVAEVGVDGTLVHLLTAAAWGCLAWLTAGAAVAALAQLPGGVGRSADRVARVVTPALVRRVVEALLGASALVGVVTPAAASAAAPAVAATTSTAVSAGSAGSAGRQVEEAGGARTVGAAAVVGATPAQALPPLGSADWPGRSRRVLPTADWPEAPASALPRSAAPAVTPGLVAAAPVRESADEAVVVRRGDTLWSIAAHHLGPDASPAEVARSWPEWHRGNRAVIGADPDRLLPGQRLVPPT
jgi:nucleoid-associated protein YgaU